ncbi:putative zinc transport system zinc-binding lipoprotein AdcA precursor [Clostridium sp. N3C]|nr:putative zinc transport system zinc-binding lipoprotein AdcA precursor [Clostridium sp. N3C]
MISSFFVKYISKIKCEINLYFIYYILCSVNANNLHLVLTGEITWIKIVIANNLHLQNTDWGVFMFNTKSKLLIFLMLFTLCLGLFAGCSKEKNTKNTKYSIVCTTFPQYDWVMKIIGDKSESFSVTLLLDNGVDLHSYQPTAEDIATIANCDLFIHVGGESDAWVKDALKEKVNKDIQVINMVEALGDRVKDEEIVEGMEDNDEHGDEQQHEDEHEKDEHIWLSLKNAEFLVKNIAEAIKKIDKEKESVYQRNSEDYIQQLRNLDKEYEKAIAGASKKTIVFGDRFPFRYLADDYDLSYYAAFSGCSAETEASFETVVFLAKKVDELNLNTVFVIENSDKKIAQTIINNTKSKNQKILVMNSLQSVTKEDIDKGTTYLSAMKNNLEVLIESLK